MLPFSRELQLWHGEHFSYSFFSWEKINHPKDSSNLTSGFLDSKQNKIFVRSFGNYLHLKDNKIKAKEVIDFLFFGASFMSLCRQVSFCKSYALTHTHAHTRKHGVLFEWMWTSAIRGSCGIRSPCVMSYTWQHRAAMNGLAEMATQSKVAVIQSDRTLIALSSPFLPL